MRVLILTHIFWPESADFKNLALSKALVARGHEVIVLAPFPNYPIGRLYDGYTMSWRQWEFVEGVKILRVPLYPDHSSSGLKRILNYGTFTFSASTIGLALAGKVDVVFVHSPPMTLGLTAWLFKFFQRVPVLLDVVDLWPDAIFGSGMVSSGILVKGSGWIAKQAYKIADKITVLTDGYAKRLISKGVPEEKLTVIPPWADSKLFFKSKRDIEFGREYKLDGKFCIIHAGNVGPFQDIVNVLNTAELLRDITNLLIVFVGAGRDLQKMKEKAAEYNLQNVVFTGSYPVHKMSGIYAWAEGLLVSLRSDPYLAINLPSKLTGYLASGKPIIACADGETRRLIVENELGLSCKPGNPFALADTLTRFMNLSNEERSIMGIKSKKIFNVLFDKDVLIKKYINMLEAMSG